jgi:hypothetical protein
MNRINLSNIHVVCVAAAFLTLLAACSSSNQTVMEPLTKGGLEAAERLWEARGSNSYDLVVRLEAARMETTVYDVVVRGGEIVSIKRNGQAVPLEYAEDYSVLGLFGQLRQELRLMERSNGTPDALAELFARFDPDTGRLDRYRRTTSRRKHLRIEVLKYEPRVADLED